MKKDFEISVMGMWHLGCVYAASFAKLGYSVTCFDYDEFLIKNLQKGVAPIHEPHLEDYIDEYKENLSFQTSEEDAIKGKKYIFVTFDLPIDEQDKVQLDLIDKVIVSLKKYYERGSILVLSSQVPLGTSRRIMEEIEVELKFKPQIIYFPENLRLGSAFDAFFEPERIILGSDSKETIAQFIKDFPFFEEVEILEMGLESAEMLKHALNSYLAMCISFSSEMGDLCELLGANANDVVKGLKSDKRVSKFAPLNPGCGFAGGTLGRDLQSLFKLSSERSYEPKLLKSVYSVNQDRLPMLIKKIKNMYPSLSGKNVGILGLTYKPNTNTLRRSMSLGLISLLHEEQARIKAYDPVIKEPIDDFGYLEVCPDLDDFFENLDFVVLMTDWPEFRDIEFGKYSNSLSGKMFFDAKNFLDADVLTDVGFRYAGIGI